MMKIILSVVMVFIMTITNAQSKKEQIENLNQKFSSPEQIKKFSILPRDFSIDDGELTPTLKIRRKQINENWLDTIESLYKE